MPKLVNGHDKNYIQQALAMHIGCRVYCKDSVGSDVGDLVEVRGGSAKVKYTDYNSGRWYRLEETKICARHLKDITQAEKDTFAKRFTGNDFVKHIYLAAPTDARVTYLTPGEKTRPLTAEEKLWLCRKGFDLKYLPDEHKIFNLDGETNG